ncbi:hypothetical protein EQU24_07050 [Methylotuvimicrobium buryatense]|uniref:Uncharacterized protein n=1 Tax=Methylotuvimicrobium buryatense TaxID=95641 RepID=A0A4P9ULN9_METBY|nr:hypothetical protein EQU24_07050 [Methylotuvimicrobium buryatense]
MPRRYIPFALQISAVPKEVPGCSAKALPAWSRHRAYMDVFTPVPNFDLRWVYISRKYPILGICTK